MNKRGQVQILRIMLMVFAFVVAVVVAVPLKELTTIARNGDNLDCETEGQSTGVFATCIIVDWFLPIFVGVAIFSGGSFLALRKRS